MRDTPAALDPDRLLRVAGALSESGAAVRLLAPGVAHDYQQVADMLVAAAALQLAAHAPKVAPRPPSKAPRLSKHRQHELARKWWIEREQSVQPGQPRPSQAQDFRDARRDAANGGCPGVARDMIKKLRPPDW